MEVALIQWPSDEALRAELAERGQPRLLLVEPDAEPPACLDPLEDWVRLPVSRADRKARVRTLENRSRTGWGVPSLDELGTLRYRDTVTQLSVTQARLIDPMIRRFGGVVSRETLSSAAWPEAANVANKLDVTIGRLRRELEPMSLRIVTVRSRGYLLDDARVGRQPFRPLVRLM